MYGILTSLTTAITYVSYAPFSPTKGYFNIGELMVFFSALTFGWRAGAICGGIGSAAADILLGSGVFAPITLVAKGTEGFVVGILGRQDPGKGWSAMLVVATGVLAALGSLKLRWPSPETEIQEWTLQIAVFFVAVFAVLVVFFQYKQAFVRWTPVVLGIALGGSCMIITYFVGEYYVLDVGFGRAALEVPVNIAQVLVGGLIGAPLSYYVIKSYPALRQRT